MVLAKVAYAPIYWLLECTPMGHWQPAQLYFDAWGF
jgi:hypothetical protein